MLIQCYLNATLTLQGVLLAARALQKYVFVLCFFSLCVSAFLSPRVGFKHRFNSVEIPSGPCQAFSFPFLKSLQPPVFRLSICCVIAAPLTDTLSLPSASTGMARSLTPYSVVSFDSDKTELVPVRKCGIKLWPSSGAPRYHECISGAPSNRSISCSTSVPINGGCSRCAVNVLVGKKRPLTKGF